MISDMKKFLRVLFIFCTLSIFANGQVQFEKYFSESLLPTIDNSKYLNVKFAWNIPGKVQASMNEGLTLMENEKFETAIVQFDAVLKQEPSFWPAYYYRGASQKALYHFKEAEKDFLSAITLNEKQSEVFIALGECYQQQKFGLIKAELQYEKAITISPSSVAGHYALGNIEFFKSNTRKALKYFEKCNQLDPRFAPAFLMQGILKIREAGKKNNEALGFMNKALEADSTYREGLFWRGMVYMSLGKNDKCLKDWDRLVKYNPNNPFFLLLRGFLHIELNDFDRAFNDLRKAVLLRTTSEDKFVGGQTLLDKQIDIQYASAYAMRFSYGLDDQALSFFKKGFCYFLAGKSRDASKNFQRAAAVQPSATVHFLQALNYEHMGAHDSAFVFYDKALSLDNEIFDAHKKRGIYRFEVKDWRGAYADFNEMIRLQPETMVTYRLRGFVRGHQKDYAGGIIDLTKFIKSDSSDAEVFKTRGFCRGMIGDKRGELEDYVQALKIKKDRNLVDEVINGYVLLGDTSSTLSCINEFKDFRVDQHFQRVEKIEFFISIRYWKHALAEIDSCGKLAIHKEQHSELALLQGLVHFYQEKYDVAVFHFNQALILFSDNYEARYFRGKAYLKLGQNQDALIDFKFLKSIDYADAKQIYQTLKH
jgi:tetratricopeptide (TPR) repeat protein